eukprot:TRINITY_DN5073_c0_g1_i1.p1 TRINITY_DN5073_c0_g1~~TRINITY_DN5073_c0_g1_i1.p1  ORF type:complete len:229 (-),score=54.12 TRINITY_DN5073_c0_g1_i1:4-651(-)
MKATRLIPLCIFAILLLSVAWAEEKEDEEEFTEDVSSLTCGSAIKLRHVLTGHRLHSHTVSYGSGSGQQSVTGFPNIDDPNSLWIVRNAMGAKHCSRGTVVKNGDIIRLQHLATQRNLHSHLHSSPLTNQQEVSCFGEGGNGDTGDNWKVVIDTDVVKRGEVIKFQHVDTGKWLSSNKNKFSNPIPGQTEVCATSKTTREIEWVVEEGFFFPARK